MLSSTADVVLKIPEGLTTRVFWSFGLYLSLLRCHVIVDVKFPFFHVHVFLQLRL